MHRSTPSARVPTLTEVIEYVDEVMSVRALAGEPITDGEAPPGADPGGAPEFRLAGLEGERLQTLMDSICQRVDESLDARMSAALRPIFERATDEAMRVSREVSAQLVREVAEALLRQTQPRAAGDTSP